MMPEFLKKEYEGDYDEVSKLIEEYDEKIGADLPTVGLDMTRVQLKEALTKCLETGKTFAEVMNIETDIPKDVYI